MELYIPSNGPFIFVMENNNLPISDIVDAFKDSFIELDKGRRNSPVYCLWDNLKLYIFIFNTLNEKKFLDFYSKFFFEKQIDNSIVYKNFGINLLEFIARERGAGHYVLLVENVDDEFYNKTSDNYYYIDISYGAYNLSANELSQIQSTFRKYCKSAILDKKTIFPSLNQEKFLELYIKFSDGESYKIGFIYFVSTGIYEKKFIILLLPRPIITQHLNFLKKLVFSFNRIYSHENVYSSLQLRLSEPFFKLFDAIDQITIGADFEFELYDKIDDGTVSASSILAYTIYKDKDSVNLRRTKIGVDGNSSIGELRTTPVKISELDKFFEDVDKLIEKTKKGISVVFNNISLNFIGKKYPLGFHIHFGIPKQVIGKDFANLSLEEANYFEKSIESLLNLILYRYLYTLNSFRRWGTEYASFNSYDKTRKKKYGIEYRLLPSSIVYEDFYKTVIAFAVDLIKKYFTRGNSIRVPLNKYYEIDESFYPAGFFEKLWKVKELVNLNDNGISYYEQLVENFTRFEKESPEFLKCWKEIDEMVNLLNSVYLKNGFVYYDYYSFDTDEEKLLFKIREYYDMINRKPITLYGFFIPIVTIWRIATKNHDAKFTDVVYEMLKEMEIREQLKLKLDTLWNEFTNKFDILKPKNEKVAIT